MNKMLISGGNGFLGSHLAQKAIKEGFRVTVLDDFSTSVRVNNPDEVTIIRGRVEDINLQNNFENMVHLTSRPLPDDYTINSVEALMSNSVGTMKLLEIARR